MSSSQVFRGIGIEMAILLAAGGILHLRSWHLRRLTRPLSLFGALAGLPLFVAYVLLYWFTAFTVVSAFPAAANAVPLQIVPTASPLVMLVFIVINSIYEEFAVAGYVITALSTRNGAAFSITASTLIRFLYHVYQGPLASLSILPLGVLFGVVYWRTRNLWTLVVAHTIANILTFLVFTQRAT